MTLRGSEWEVLHPLSGELLAIVRLVRLGRREDPYYRAVTPSQEPSQRRLLGYWRTPEEARLGVFGELEHLLGESMYGGGSTASFPRVPQKPPPTPVESGRAATPKHHSARR